MLVGGAICLASSRKSRQLVSARTGSSTGTLGYVASPKARVFGNVLRDASEAVQSSFARLKVHGMDLKESILGAISPDTRNIPESAKAMDVLSSPGAEQLGTSALTTRATALSPQASAQVDDFFGAYNLVANTPAMGI